LLDKPNACLFCPFYGDGKGFVPDRLNDQAELLIVGQNPGADEEAGRRLMGWEGPKRPLYEPAEPQPFIGETGFMMDRKFLPMTGLDRSQISLSNAIRCRLSHRNELPILQASVAAKKAVEHCQAAYSRIPEKTKIILTQGEYALYAMTGAGIEKGHKVGDWRGYMLPYQPITQPRKSNNMIYNPISGLDKPPVLATYHIAYILHDPTASIITQWDWGKVRKFLDMKWPLRMPAINLRPPMIWAPYAAFDTEYNPETKEFICYSYYDGMTLAVSNSLFPPKTFFTPHIIFQNAVADIPYLRQMFPKFTFDDIMHMHAVLWSDFPHDLNFLGSLYAPINRWKHLDAINPKLYSAADAYATWEISKPLRNELERDLRSKFIYETKNNKLPLIILRAEEAGILINQPVAKQRYLDRMGKVEDLVAKAQAIAGWPINIHSNPQASHHLYEVEKLVDIL